MTGRVSNRSLPMVSGNYHALRTRGDRMADEHGMGDRHDRQGRHAEEVTPRDPVGQRVHLFERAGPWR